MSDEMAIMTFPEDASPEVVERTWLDMQAGRAMRRLREALPDGAFIEVHCDRLTPDIMVIIRTLDGHDFGHSAPSGASMADALNEAAAMAERRNKAPG